MDWGTESSNPASSSSESLPGADFDGSMRWLNDYDPQHRPADAAER
jgi:hypothetical protein